MLQNLGKILVYYSNGRPIEAYAQCFMEIEGFGPLTVKEVPALHANVDGLGLAWMSGSRGDGKESAH